MNQRQNVLIPSFYILLRNTCQLLLIKLEILKDPLIQFIKKIVYSERKALLHFRSPPIVIYDSSWKNAAESLAVALTLTLGEYESATAPKEVSKKRYLEGIFGEKIFCRKFSSRVIRTSNENSWKVS